MLDPRVVDELRAIVGPAWVLDSEADRAAYAYDGAPGYRSLPDAVVFPGATEQVQAVVRLAAREGIPLLPRGQATNLSGGTVPVEGGIVLVMTRMNRILELDRENLTVTVEPGVITAQLQRQVEAEGLFYPPDPGSVAVSTIGGNVAENAGGLRGLKYGVTGDYVMGLEAVLANGERITTGGKNVKDVAGYDLTRLLVGSEGTLAIITRIILRLIPLPPARQVALAVYTRLEEAARSVERIIAARMLPATLEFLDQGTIQAVEAFARVGLPTDAQAVLLIGQDGPEEQVANDIAAAAAICREAGAVRVEVGASPEEGDRLMAARRAALSALARIRPTTILEDATVPRARLVEMLQAIQEAAARHRVTICTFGHAGDGNLHPTCLTDERDREEMARVEAAFEDIFRAAIQLGGTITGEHGVGLAKQNYLEWKVGPAGMAAMRAIKEALDPQNLLNPGKILPRQRPRRLVVRQG
ncbi:MULTISPECIES: FAD-binding oxidoreductase [Limnochorda]|uniref:FAD-binding oxidoreductase n=1 Tax=Limnochorda TaxID=1676651 RepID=UPI00181A4F8A|nr:FAD-linked oxidase C-terminal domain-containing protein [Limnochorda pilosa]MBO2485719.1 glycolate oxidase subunit GlcD [Bacillota bacterium]MBO2518243.1 glycolate oxidase subunit GlcD [Bacillota bacterium]NMA70938.1 FAD-binding protein [Bacillota bacterium]